MTWTPHPGAQEEFCSRGEFEALFGGAAGPGKTDCLVSLATRYIEFPDYKGILFRRTFPQLQEIIDRCWKIYPTIGGMYRATEHRWYFPSGATVALSHMQHEADMYNHQGKEYQFIGFDELTQFMEKMYLYLFSRARSTNPKIPPRVRSSTNPGGIGHNWVKERFVTITDHGKTYIDPKTRLSRVFIPATIEDNPSLFENDPDYIARLEALPEIEKLRLRHGIWDAFEGQVFPELSRLTHGCEPFDIPPEWERICVLDWGFAKPFSVGWYAIDYDGVLWRYREWYGCKEGEPDVGLKMPAYEVARGILEREHEKVKYRIADPSIWHPRPESRKGESRGPTIQEDMASEGVFFLKADNDRLQGKMQVHKRLRVEEEIDTNTGEIIGEHPMFRVFNNHHHFWRTMQAIQEDPKNPEDVDTDQEDHCFASGTMVLTTHGPRPIEQLMSGWVYGRRGAYPFWARMTRKNAEVVRLGFDDGSFEICTPDHKFFTESGWVEAIDLLDEFSYNVLVERRTRWLKSSATRLKSFLALGIGSAVTTSNGREFACTGLSGSITTDHYPTDGTFTTKTGIEPITKFATSASLTHPTICQGTERAETRASGNRPCAMGQRSGTEARKESVGTLSRPRNTFARRLLRKWRKIVNSAVIGLWHMKLSRFAHVIAVLTARQRRCVSVEPWGRSDVYCLNVPGPHSFALSDGTLVHNCYDEFRYMCMSRPVAPKKVHRIPPGSFQAERNRYIKAKRYAERHGVSMNVAYQRVR